MLKVLTKKLLINFFYCPQLNCFFFLHAKGKNKPEFHYGDLSPASSVVVIQSCQCLLQPPLEAIHHLLS